MALFNFFGESEHNVFDYKPIYYDKKEEERRRMFGAVDGSADKKAADGSYAPGSYIKGALRGGNYQKSHGHMRRTQSIIGIISLVLIFVVLYFIAKFYTLL